MSLQEREPFFVGCCIFAAMCWIAFCDHPLAGCVAEAREPRRDGGSPVYTTGSIFRGFQEPTVVTFQNNASEVAFINQCGRCFVHLDGGTVEDTGPLCRAVGPMVRTALWPYELPACDGGTP